MWGGSLKVCHKKFIHFWQLFSAVSPPGTGKMKHCLELWAAEGASTTPAPQPICTAGIQGTHRGHRTPHLGASFCPPAPRQGKPALPSQLCQGQGQQGRRLRWCCCALQGALGCKRHGWHQTWVAADLEVRSGRVPVMGHICGIAAHRTPA